jgi:hypothetical protein
VRNKQNYGLKYIALLVRIGITAGVSYGMKCESLRFEEMFDLANPFGF